jgi:hemerythrin superfamily protein
VRRLFREFETAGEKAHATRKKIVDEIVAELCAHAFIEEEIFYPTARAAVPETSDHVLESIEEHHVVVWMLSELADLDPSDERYTAKVTVLIENVRHHVEEEEQDWFPKVRKAMSRTRLRELGERMEAAKARAPRNPLDLRSARA